MKKKFELLILFCAMASHAKAAIAVIKLQKKKV
jgi:hypothetical protein